MSGRHIEKRNQKKQYSFHGNEEAQSANWRK